MCTAGPLALLHHGRRLHGITGLAFSSEAKITPAGRDFLRTHTFSAPLILLVRTTSLTATVVPLHRPLYTLPDCTGVRGVDGIRVSQTIGMTILPNSTSQSEAAHQPFI